MQDYFKLNLSDEEIGNISSLGLAHVGDAVYELLIRAWICKNRMFTSKGMHKAAVAYVNAHAQSVFADKILPVLSDDEMAVFKRGRNAKVNSIPKNAMIAEYHSATGLEALIGHLYLKGRNERISELFDVMIKE